MFTNEFNFDEICITVLDDSGQHEDLIVNVFDDVVYIRQDDEFLGEQILAISPEQWEDLIQAIHSKEGAFRKA